MDRRSFLTGLPALPLVSLPALASTQPGLRIIGNGWPEMVDDPGHKLWSQHTGTFAGQWRVLLNGESQYWFSAADENEQWVRRTATVGDDPSFGASLCMSNGNWLEEIVYGRVEIVPLVTKDVIKYYPFETIRARMPYLYSRLKIEGINCPVGYYK